MCVCWWRGSCWCGKGTNLPEKVQRSIHLNLQGGTFPVLGSRIKGWMRDRHDHTVGILFLSMSCLDKTAQSVRAQRVDSCACVGCLSKAFRRRENAFAGCLFGMELLVLMKWL